jgi:glutamate racemase
VRPLIEEIVAELASGPVTVIDTGAAVSRQLAKVLAENGLLQAAPHSGRVSAFTSGSESAISVPFARLLQLQPPVSAVAATAQPAGISSLPVI